MLGSFRSTDNIVLKLNVCKLIPVGMETHLSRVLVLNVSYEYSSVSVPVPVGVTYGLVRYT